MFYNNVYIVLSLSPVFIVITLNYSLLIECPNTNYRQILLKPYYSVTHKSYGPLLPPIHHWKKDVIRRRNGFAKVLEDRIGEIQHTIHSPSLPKCIDWIANIQSNTGPKHFHFGLRLRSLFLKSFRLTKKIAVGLITSPIFFQYIKYSTKNNASEIPFERTWPHLGLLMMKQNYLISKEYDCRQEKETKEHI